MKATSDDPEGFIERVESARERAGLGRYAFSAAIEQGDSYWSVWITRHKDRGGFPAGNIMAKMCGVLGVTMDYLLGTEANGQGAESVPEIQTASLADLLVRIGARPVADQYVEDAKGSAGRPVSRIGEPSSASHYRATRGSNAPERIQLVGVADRGMERLIFAGDLVHVDTGRVPAIGDIAVAVRFHDETIVRFLRERDGRRFLEGLDGTTVPLDQDTRVIGPLVALQISAARLLREARRAR
jgi:hypothetical protein